MDSFKEKLIKDLISVCSIPTLSEHILHECLRLVFSWALTARDDDGNSAKYFGCPYWSRNALEHYNKTCNVKGLRHEHIIPRAIFNQSIENFRDDYIVNPNIAFDESYCFDYLKQHISDKLFACVITEEEDKAFSTKGLSKKMPEYESDNFFEIQDPWARYKEAGITDIRRVTWTKKSRGEPWIYTAENFDL